MQDALAAAERHVSLSDQIAHTLMCNRHRTAGQYTLDTLRLPTHYALVKHHFELIVSLPQHSGRCGSSEVFQPPPSAWTSVTALTMRRPRMFTAVTSSESAAL